MTSKRISILLCQPRGFCAGVDRAIKIVEYALNEYGPPVYVRHEIVHNRFVVSDLTARGAVFVEDLDQIPPGDAPVIFSAHGVAPHLLETAHSRGMFVVDAVCPLVSKVHLEAVKYNRQNCHIVLIGHSGHPEVEGTLGHVPDDAIDLVETCKDVETLDLPENKPIACLTQTTLSVDDTAEVLAALRNKFPNLIEPGHEDICYATTNRQSVVKVAAPKCDHFLVIGSPNSSNSLRLVEVAQKAGCHNAVLVGDETEVDYESFASGDTVGISAGASAPEILVQRVVMGFRERFETDVKPVGDTIENVTFKIPSQLSRPREDKTYHEIGA